MDALVIFKTVACLLVLALAMFCVSACGARASTATDSNVKSLQRLEYAANLYRHYAGIRGKYGYEPWVSKPTTWEQVRTLVNEVSAIEVPDQSENKELAQRLVQSIRDYEAQLVQYDAFIARERERYTQCLKIEEEHLSATSAVVGNIKVSFIQSRGVSFSDDYMKITDVTGDALQLALTRIIANKDHSRDLLRTQHEPKDVASEDPDARNQQAAFIAVLREMKREQPKGLYVSPYLVSIRLSNVSDTKIETVTLRKFYEYTVTDSNGNEKQRVGSYPAFKVQDEFTNDYKPSITYRDSELRIRPQASVDVTLTFEHPVNAATQIHIIGLLSEPIVLPVLRFDEYASAEKL